MDKIFKIMGLTLLIGFIVLILLYAFFGISVMFLGVPYEYDECVRVASNLTTDFDGWVCEFNLKKLVG